jgi:4-amino-4-deoxy-L-arabinose transferase-like glycosyltransferase
MRDQHERVGRAPLVSALLVAVLVRAVLAWAAWQGGGADALMTPDSHSYLATATSLVERSQFERAPGRPEIFRTPGYPLLLSAGIRLGSALLFAVLAQIALACGVVILTYAYALRFLGRRRALACAFIAAVEPVSVLWSVKIMAETLLTFLVMLFAYCALRALDDGRASWTVGAAAAVSLAAYAKPIAWPLAVLVAALAWVRYGHAPGSALRRGAVVTLTCAALLAPWHLRNAHVAGYAGFSSLHDLALYVSVGGSVEARRDHVPYADVRLQKLARARGSTTPPFPGMREEGLALLRSDPFGYAGTHVQGMLRTMFEPGAVEYLRTFGAYRGSGALQRATDVGVVAAFLQTAREEPHLVWPTVGLAVLLAPLILLPLVAAWRLAAGSRLPFAILAFIAVYFIVAGGGVPGQSRMRAPAVPALVLMSVAATVRRRAAARLPA